MESPGNTTSQLLNFSIHVLLILSIFFVTRCVQGESSSGLNESKIVKKNEIREYEGKKLSSMNDFRENSIKGPQYVDKKTYRLKMSGLIKNPRQYTYEEVINNHRHYKKVVTLYCVEGWNVTILLEGILVRDLIKNAIPSPEAKIIIFRSHDGYSTSFPIDYIMENDIIMAHKMNGVIIPSERGFPFQLVAEGKLGYKWIKWITEIVLSDDIGYKGYWESRGYSNTGDLNKNFFE